LQDEEARAILFVVFLVSVVIALNSAWGQEKNLYVNKEVTAKIQTLDPAFFSGFDVYSAGVLEAPTALLFDIRMIMTSQPGSGEIRSVKNRSSMLFGSSLISQNDNKNIPFPPRALNIVNLKGKVLGYVYTGLNSVLMDRKKDGSVSVYPPVSCH